MGRTRSGGGPGGGPSQRQLRVGELIRRTLSDVLARGDIPDPDLDGVSVTVSEVRASPDLRHARAYVMPLGGALAGQDVAGVVAALNRHRGALRRLVTAEITLKHSPELAFVVDKSFEAAERTRRLMESEPVRRDLREPPAED
jgi:ribosome-binding factor A